MADDFSANVKKWLGYAAALGVAAYALYVKPATVERGVVPLPALNVRVDNTSVSGISSGAYMAGQFQFAHAKNVVGAAIIAGGPYGCSESAFAGMIPGANTAMLNLGKAVNGCMLDLMRIWGVADPATLARHAVQRAEANEIDPIDDVKQDRVYLFSGTEDHTVMPTIVKSAADFYTKLGVPESNIKLVTSYPAGHAFVTDHGGGACERSGDPYVVNCGYDQAGDLLKHIYGALAPRGSGSVEAGAFVEFDQKPFGGGGSNGLAASGVVYVPNACGEATCSVHIAFHGCAQNRETVGDAFIKQTGFAGWADTNKLVILFPQVATAAFNPQACWDWWGYTGDDYLTRKAPQIEAVWQMLTALHAKP